MSVKSSGFLIILLCAVVTGWSLYRDVQLEKQNTGDLRNRVVGARMQKDGLSPYFYKWKKGDGTRYYDPANFDTVQVSNVTASPFFHHLLYPIAELPQHSISKYWLLIEYTMLAMLLLLALLLAGTQQQQWLLLLTACSFLLTEGWKLHVGNGQNYLVVPLLAMAFYFFMRNTKSLPVALAAGVCAATFILIKPNAVVFFLPFLFLLNKYSFRYIMVLLLPMLIALVWIFSSSQEMFFWKQYKENIAQQIKIHQQESPVVQKNEPSPGFAIWEGMDQAQIKSDSIRHPIHIYSENGNVFVLFRIAFHKNIPTSTLFVLSAACIFLLLLVFYLKQRPAGFNWLNAAYAGYALFMMADFFSPVYRHQYYTVQWLFPLLLSAAVYRPALRNVYLMLAAGLLLNILNIPFVPMEHTIGEYIMLVAFIVLSLRRETEPIQ